MNSSRQIPHATLTSCYPPPVNLNRSIYTNHTDTYPCNITIQPLHRSARHGATGMSCELLPPPWASTNPGCKTMLTLSLAKFLGQRQHTLRSSKVSPLNAYKLKAPSR